MSGEERSSPMPEPLEEENLRLKRAVEELSVLNQLAVEIGSSHEPQRILESIVTRSLRAVQAEQGVLMLVHPQGEKSAKTLVRATYSSSREQRYELADSVLGWMFHNKGPLLINSPKEDGRFSGEQWDGRIASLLSVPLMIKSQLTGILTVYNKKDHKDFTEEDQRLLAILASQSAQIVESTRLYDEEKELIRMQVEWDAAARIQEHLLPRTPPDIPGYDIAGKSLAARNVGGDFFDFIRVDENRWVVSLGDVSGKGLPAALLMANLQATIRGQSVLRVPMRECLARSNNLLYQSTEPERFATAFYGILDLDRESFSYSNAGHNYPLLYGSEEGPRQLEAGGPALGVFPDCVYEEEEISFRPGDFFVIFSDGVIDAANESNEQFGEERLQRIIEEQASQSAQGLVESVIESVSQHAGRAPQTDDITIVVVKNQL